jgi:hypothetical protein
VDTVDGHSRRPRLVVGPAHRRHFNPLPQTSTRLFCPCGDTLHGTSRWDFRHSFVLSIRRRVLLRPYARGE